MTDAGDPSVVLYAEDAFVGLHRAIGVAALRPPLLEPIRRPDPSERVWLIAVDPASVAADGRIPVPAAAPDGVVGVCGAVALVSDGAGGIAEIGPAVSVVRGDVPVEQACLARSHPGHTQIGPLVPAGDAWAAGDTEIEGDAWIEGDAGVGGSIEVRINGAVAQTGEFADLAVSPRRLMASIARYVQLQPGDVVLIGAPPGSAGDVVDRGPDPCADRPLDAVGPGDRVEVTLRTHDGAVGLTCSLESADGSAASSAMHRPRVLGTGSNYRSHLAEMGAGPPRVPSVNFFKLPGSVRGEGEIGIRPDWRADYEGEIAVVIGEVLHDVDPADVVASDVRLTLANDLTAREAPLTHLTIAKSAPGFCPLGSNLVPISEVDLAELEFVVEVNGEHRQTGRADDMVFTIPEIVSSVSRSTVLRPGDIILTGSPAGVGAAVQPQRFLTPGDEIRIHSRQLGELTSRIVASPDHEARRGSGSTTRGATV